MGIIRYKDIAYGGGSSVTEGYYKVADGKFYEHFDGTTYSDEITGEDGILYLDLSTNNLYRWSTGASLFVLVGKSTLASLNDTNISSPTDGQALEYNGTSSKWVNVAKKAADTPTFSEASTRANLSGSGETMATILGKIKKWFTDLKDLAFIGKDGTTSTKYLRGDGTWQAFPDLNGEKSVTGNPITFTDGSESYASQLDVELKPIQDLHGYDRPWVGGAGKNKLPMTVEGIKAANTSGSWSGNTYTYNGVTFDILTDSGENVTGIKFNNIANAQTQFHLITSTYSENVYKGYKLNGCSSGSSSTYDLMAVYSNNGSSYASESHQYNSDLTISSSYDYIRVSILIRSGYNASNVIIYPMIRLSTETDSTFAPYTNICPISGISTAEVETTNGTDTNTATITLGRTVYGGYVDFLTGVVTVDKTVKTITGSESGASITWNSYSFKVNDGIDSNSEIGVYESSYSDDALTGSEMYSSRASGHDYGYCVGSGQIMRVRNRSLTQDLASYQAWLQSNTIQVCYKLATPLTIRLSPAELKLLQGNNTVTTNGYSISMKYQPQNLLGDVLESAEEYSNRNIKGWQYYETITGSFYDRSYDKPISDNAKEVMFIARIGVTGDYVATTIATEMLGTVRLYAGTSYLQFSKTKVNASDATFGVLTIYVR